MGIAISLNSVCNLSNQYQLSLSEMAIEVIKPLLKSYSKKISHLVVATTCPDTLAPTLGQRITQHFDNLLSESPVYDLVQGCAGGVSALGLGSHLSNCNKSNVLVVLADSARQSVSASNPLRNYLSNGAFACLMSYENSNKNLIHYKTKQYKELTDIVSVKLGHAAHKTIIERPLAVQSDPMEELGLHMDNTLAAGLFIQAKSFYKDFLKECSSKPDIMVFHQANPRIIEKLSKIFSSEVEEFVDVAHETGNCGTASVGVALYKIKDRIKNKKVFLCSFGTGGVISAGLWQF